MSKLAESKDVALDLLYREAKARIDVANRHKDKYHQNARSAALLLIDAKQKTPRGQFDAKLEEFGIKRSTAYRLMQEHRDPAVAIKRQAQDAESHREQRATEKSQTSGTIETPPPPKPTPVYHSKPATVHRLDYARAIQMINRLTEEQVKQVITFIGTL